MRWDCFLMSDIKHCWQIGPSWKSSCSNIKCVLRIKCTHLQMQLVINTSTHFRSFSELPQIPWWFPLNHSDVGKQANNQCSPNSLHAAQMFQEMWHTTQPSSTHTSLNAGMILGLTASPVLLSLLLQFWLYRPAVTFLSCAFLHFHCTGFSSVPSGG